jgi:hypothetical protein
MRNNATAQQNKAPFGKLCFALLCFALLSSVFLLAFFSLFSFNTISGEKNTRGNIYRSNIVTRAVLL